MIFTDQFVYVHEPKTGGTFVTSVLFQLYGVRWTPLTRLLSALRTEVRYRHRYGTLVYHNHKHGGCNDIPAAQQHKPVLATVRNPYDMYVSQYEFGWWKRPEWHSYFTAIPGFAAQYPHFPQLSFAEYVRLSNLAFGDPGGAARPDAPLGLLSEKFVKFYCRDPQQVLATLAAAPDQAACRAALHDLQFIRTDQLNQALHAFLLAQGYAADDLRFVLSLGKILPGGKGRQEQQRWPSYYTPELRQWVRRQEWLLFALFPDFDVPLAP